MHAEPGVFRDKQGVFGDQVLQRLLALAEGSLDILCLIRVDRILCGLQGSVDLSIVL